LKIQEKIDRNESYNKLCCYIDGSVCDPKSELPHVSVMSKARSAAVILGQCIFPKFEPMDEEERTGKSQPATLQWSMRQQKARYIAHSSVLNSRDPIHLVEPASFGIVGMQSSSYIL